MRTVVAVLAAGMMVVTSPAQAASAPHYRPGTIYFNKTETAQLTYLTGVAAVRSVAAAPFGRIIGDNAAEIMVRAGSANMVGQCVKITSMGAIGTYGGNDGDGFCQ
ncbi:hypothetical protein Acy02nite_56710 [Actinoplanes cyaneus]|uniref:Uncharacterized protein n=1 Tax=Actinoplanes cyaneus TaxID=52696 RepID=A0A919M301_9ACTN|nr:hypothetical protein [Actinoplanes cyaneus]MCW2139916.1 hypothetical protein [Actinoplanes cyaneus]GID67790.1 hypothetical protein Acy02nite_56710 [Actinoplanes cyaneus]